LPAAARAQDCRVESAGAQTPAWQTATESLAGFALSDRDCLRVRIVIEGEGARVLFTTPDGRSAERFVAAPSELRATVEALRVQGPAATTPQASEPAAAQTPAAPIAATPSPAPSSGLGLALLGGFRGGPESLLSPLIIGELSLSFGILELGASLAAEIQYFDVTGSHDPARQGSAAALGLHAGVRQPVGSVALRAGARIAFASLLTVNSDSQACQVGMMCFIPEHDERASEWRLGAYAGIVVPRASTLRLRADVAADLITPTAPSQEVALTPSPALSAVLGLEVAP